jgi:hypothetical protein
MVSLKMADVRDDDGVRLGVMFRPHLFYPRSFRPALTYEIDFVAATPMQSVYYLPIYRQDLFRGNTVIHSVLWNRRFRSRRNG